MRFDAHAADHFQATQSFSKDLSRDVAVFAPSERVSVSRAKNSLTSRVLRLQSAGHRICRRLAQASHLQPASHTSYLECVAGGNGRLRAHDLHTFQAARLSRLSAANKEMRSIYPIVTLF